MNVSPQKKGSCNFSRTLGGCVISHSSENISTTEKRCEVLKLRWEVLSCFLDVPLRSRKLESSEGICVISHYVCTLTKSQNEPICQELLTMKAGIRLINVFECYCTGHRENRTLDRREVKRVTVHHRDYEVGGRPHREWLMRVLN